MRLAAAIAFAVTLASGEVAEASARCCNIYDAAPDRGLAVKGPQAGLDVEGGGFRVPGGGGDFVGVVARGEVALPLDFSLRARVPYYLLQTSFGQFHGIGDAGLALKRPLWRSSVSRDAAEVSAGFATDFPTADPHSGLGMGHFMFTPVLAVAVPTGPVGWQVEASYLYAMPFGEHGAHGHKRFVDAHDLQELNVNVFAGYRLTDWLWLRAGAMGTASVVLSPSEVGSRVDLSPGAVVRVGDVVVAAAAELPVTTNRALDWRMTLGGTWRF